MHDEAPRRFRKNKICGSIIDYISYEPSTGVFKWIKKPYRKSNVCVGDIAGSYTDQGYITIRFKGVPILAHRLAWFFVNGEFPSERIDHKNRVRSDNRIDNLRQISQTENCQNRVSPGSKYGMIGAYRISDGKWRSIITLDAKPIHLGYFKTQVEAHAAYMSAKSRHHPGWDRAM